VRSRPCAGPKRGRVSCVRTDAASIAAAVCAVMTTRMEWTGTASELLGALAELAGERAAKANSWPDSSRALAGRLRRAATFLRKIGIDIGFEREGRARTIRITTASFVHARTGDGDRPHGPHRPPISRNSVRPNHDRRTSR
jgi:hypothetical protein